MRRKPKSAKKFVFFICIALIGAAIVAASFSLKQPMLAQSVKAAPSMETVQQATNMIYDVGQKLIGLATGSLGIALAIKELKD